MKQTELYMHYTVQLYFTLYHKDQRQQGDSRVLLRIIAVKINFSLGFENRLQNKQTSILMNGTSKLYTFKSASLTV